MLATFVIFARESLESSMIVAILVSYLKQIRAADQIPKIWLGVAVALGVDTLAGVAILATIHQYSGTRVQTILEGLTYLVAALLLTAMSFWMKKQSRGIKKHLERDMALALSRGSAWAIFLLTLVTVGREGLETVIFMLAIALGTPTLPILAGAIAGLGLGLGLSYSIYRLGRTVRLDLFFNLFGVLLLIFGAGLIADGVENFQQLGWLPIGRQVVWHSGGLLSENSVLGDILHTFVGYAQNPTVMQVAAYSLFIILTLGYYLKKPARPLR